MSGGVEERDGLDGSDGSDSFGGSDGSDGLDGFREVQRLAYACAEAVAAQLRPGTTEREAARAMRVWAREHGVRDWFHLPFAWFGDRTAFTGFKVPLQFFPTGRRLEPGMPFILDLAPVYGGCTADIGYSGSLGPNPLQERLMADLREHRELILREVRERRPLRTIYEDVDRLMIRQGYANRHRAYPFGVIAHKVDRVTERRWSPRIAGFGAQSLKGLASDALHGHRDGWSPLWSPYRMSDHPPYPGLWAVEPHVGFRGTGAKFEEILVVTETDAYWLDDDLPHVRRRHETDTDRTRTASMTASMTGASTGPGTAAGTDTAAGSATGSDTGAAA
ncbi:M24 family metallopeptidase [Actinacidiphila alni]|uniref:M24 family metallopeptidase n=1 Tax=Actinacidiphila alni TaxID=380248 RepID=UPI0033C03199